VNAVICNSNNAARQAVSEPPRPYRPLREALIHACEVKLHLAGARRDAVGARRTECLSRLLDTVQLICGSVDRLDQRDVETVFPPSHADVDLVSAGSFQ